jgi:predicted methyltransferase
VQVRLTEVGVELPSGDLVSWAQLAHVREHENACFELHDGELVAIRGYSTELGRAVSLLPTTAAPAMLIAGFVMHRIKGISPEQGAHAMVQAVLPTRGRLLDTATGLGYAAIFAAQHCREVVTIELDPEARAMAQKNPWSRALFTAPNITRLLGDSAKLIESFDAESFNAIVHDPPAINLAGDLYSEQFYTHALRVLTRGGKMFHYIGDPHSASGGRTTKGVVRRLQSAGFRKVVPKPEAFGVLALK